MKRLFLRSAIVFLTPCVLLFIIYVWHDPFKVLRNYEEYFPEGTVLPNINKGMLSVRDFNRYYPAERFNSFILGSSMSIPYKIDEWKKYLDEDARAFHFDSSGESLRSMRLKIEYLLRSGVSLDNVLIVFPPNIFEYRDHTDVPSINPWQIDPDISFLYYHWVFLKNFYNREFIRAYIVSKILGRQAKVGLVEAIQEQPIRIDYKYNEESLPAWEHEALNDPEKFVRDRHPDFKGVVLPEEWDSFLTECGYSEIMTIAGLLREAGCSYEVVIGPRLDKKYINKKDLEVIEHAFGDSHVHDFSLKMQHVADDPVNFYDGVHYRPVVATEIMRQVYGK